MHELEREGQFVLAHSRGGLGNQLFILAAAMNLALKSGAEVVIDSSLHDIPPSRPFRSDIFLDSELVHTLVRNVKWARWKLTLQNLQIHDFCNISESNYLETKSGCMWGYFQSQVFHEEFHKEIYRSFTDSIEKYVANSESFRPAPDSITVHIRRGDYAKGIAAKVHGCIDYEYYERILESEEGKINVVSDDIESVRILRQKLPGRQIQLFAGGSDIADLHFLSRSKRLVVANSSFSWWGAVLGDQDKIVHAPKSWYRNGKKVLFPIQNSDWNLHSTTFENL